MLHTPPTALFSDWSFTYDNLGATPTTTPGGLVTAGGSANTESTTPLVLATGANLSQDIYWLEIIVHSSSGTGDRQILLDLGVDPAGGTSYTYVISNIVCGNNATVTGLAPGHCFVFPFFIKSGSQVACRIQCSQASITCRVIARFYGLPSNPMVVPRGSFSETIGTITNSSGVTITPGNAADGSWQLIGTTTKAMWWWQLGYSIANGTITGEVTFIEVARGDGSNKHIFFKTQHLGNVAETVGDLLIANKSHLNAFCHVPGGTGIYARGRCNNAPDTGYNVNMIGIGG